ncbi:Crp/Fnr family transcriptional regulator [Flavobacterium sp. GT3R68]|uniref:Crp/Fnr family transcriptional regulator n=1 Tax=Flavobacterium sp. GT3R68 TaxID=2594437 RepID=UPI000F87A9BB|nr:Crp/Fnr family transcriptional regulator [Flavobacterium sp. GT3R68]RTY89855.1 Crp/Fnr family transcriptional regulator [Flavobacterium sp. GSN2]TRW89834.1 Crp/Fnr family transcriptional regulator [Flavobacterium sp. GT3R68]
MTIEPIVKYISNLVDVSDNEIKLLSHFFKPSSFPKGTIIEKEDVVAEKLYFVRKGFVRSFFSKEGIEITTQIIGENKFITSFNSFTSGITSKENIQCISDCEVFYITKSDYEILSNKTVFWGSFCRQIYEKIISNNQQRTIDFIALSAEKRYLKLLKEQPEIIQNVPIQFIASYIGIKPESLSRIRKKIIS